jgi:hypothetical protein
MRVALIHVPRANLTIGEAMKMTKWSLVTANFFLNQLNNIAEQSREPFSLELYAKGTIVYICIAAEEETLTLITKAIYGWWADVEIQYIDDYTEETTDRTMAVSADLDLEWPDIYPLQNYRVFAWDSMAPVVTTLTRISEFENVLLQVIVRPLQDTPALHLKLGALRKVEQFCRFFRTRTWLKRDIANESLKLVKEKCLSRLFMINYRVTAFADLPKDATKNDAASLKARLAHHVRAATHAVKYLNTADENRLKTRPLRYGPS